MRVHTVALASSQFVKPLRTTAEGWKVRNAALDNQIKKYSKENTKKSATLLKTAFKSRDARDRVVDQGGNSQKTVKATTKLDEVMIQYDQYFQTHSQMEDSFCQEAIKEEVTRYNSILTASGRLAQALGGMASQASVFEAWLATSAVGGDRQESAELGDTYIDVAGDEQEEEGYNEGGFYRNEEARPPPVFNAAAASLVFSPGLSVPRRTSDDGSASELYRNSGGDAAPAPALAPVARRRPSIEPEPEPSERTPNAVAIYPYVNSMPDELSLEPGQALELLEESDDGWVRAVAIDTGEEGWFHGSFAQRNDEAMYVETVRAFVPDDAVENALGFDQGERIRILTKASEAWWLGMQEGPHGGVGFVPVTHITEQLQTSVPMPQFRSQDLEDNDAPKAPTRKKKKKGSMKQRLADDECDMAGLAEVAYESREPVAQRRSSIRHTSWTTKTRESPDLVQSGLGTNNRGSEC